MENGLKADPWSGVQERERGRGGGGEGRGRGRRGRAQGGASGRGVGMRAGPGRGVRESREGEAGRAVPGSQVEKEGTGLGPEEL